MATFDKPVSALEAQQIAVSNATIANFRQFTPGNGAAGSHPTAALGWYHAVAIRQDGSLFAWGDDYYDKLIVPAGNDFIAVAANGDHSLALRADGSIAAWGNNDYGQCNVPQGNGFTAISAGPTFSLALRADGSIAAWGADDLGQCSVPEGNFVAIAAGGVHGLALRADGSIAAWGWDLFGQTAVPAGNDFTGISAGAFYSLAQRADGSLVAWGDNLLGQCNVPAEQMMAAEAGGDHALALRPAASLAYWGDSAFLPETDPVTEKFMALIGGRYNSAALRPDGSLAIWGWNDYGQCIPPTGLTVKLPLITSAMFDLVPAAPGAVSVQIPAGVCQDGAGNPNDESNLLTISNDTDGPVALIATAAPSPTNTNPIPVTITFNEPVVGFAVEDVAVIGAAAVITGNEGDKVFTLQVTPAADGTVGISLPAGVCADAVGNPNVASNELFLEYDGTGPLATVATAAVSPTNANPIQVTITFNEPVSGFAVEDVTVTNGAAALAGNVDNLIFTLQVTPAADGSVGVSLPAGVCADALGNPNAASNVIALVYDGTGPVAAVAAAGANPTNASPIPVTITFNEPVSGFAVEDVTVTNGAAAITGNVDNLVFTLQVTPAAPGTVSVAVAAGSCTDALGNPSTASNTLGLTYDITAPTSHLTLPSRPVLSNSILSIGLQASDDMSAITTALLVKAPGTATYADTGLRVTGTTGVFQYDFTGRPSGTYSFLSQATDAAGNTQPLGGKRDDVSYNYRPRNVDGTDIISETSLRLRSAKYLIVTAGKKLHDRVKKEKKK